VFGAFLAPCGAVRSDDQARLKNGISVGSGHISAASIDPAGRSIRSFSEGKRILIRRAKKRAEKCLMGAHFPVRVLDRWLMQGHECAVYCKAARQGVARKRTPLHAGFWAGCLS